MLEVKMKFWRKKVNKVMEHLLAEVNLLRNLGK